MLKSQNGVEVAEEILSMINSPQDLHPLSNAQLGQLAEEIRQFLITSVSKTGGHLGPNLGLVETTIALHRVFNSPQDLLIFDTGHQAYVHKLLTGRKDFCNLRSSQGLSGYPCRQESVHDVVENSHASTSLAWADGISRAKQLAGKPGVTVAVIGDGAFTGGMAWEALNNLSADTERPVVIVINDNGRSYSPTIGGFAHHLDALRVDSRYERFSQCVRSGLKNRGRFGQFTYNALHGMKAGIKDFLKPGTGLFGSLGIKYLGPVDGHDIQALEFTLRRAKEFGGLVIVHLVTEKGHGYDPALRNDDDKFHAVGKIHPETGLPLIPSRFEWSQAFSKLMVEAGKRDSRLVGITAAMLLPVGLGEFQAHFPNRVFDVGIAEQHALTMAAGLAQQGYHPVVALYATFLNRAFDQLLMDVALHRAGVTVVLDRSGITGPDGPSHNGMWDISMCAMVPGLHMFIPRDQPTLEKVFAKSLAIADAPSVIRYPKGALPPNLAPLECRSSAAGLDFEILSRLQIQVPNTAVSVSKPRRLALVGLGSFAHTMMQVAEDLETNIGENKTALLDKVNNFASVTETQKLDFTSFSNLQVEVLDPVQIWPLQTELVDYLRDFDAVVIAEDGLQPGGFGQAVAAEIISLKANGADGQVSVFDAEKELKNSSFQQSRPNMPVIRLAGIPRQFLAHAEREEILQDLKLDKDSLYQLALSALKDC